MVRWFPPPLISTKWTTTKSDSNCSGDGTNNSASDDRTHRPSTTHPIIIRPTADRLLMLPLLQPPPEQKPSVRRLHRRSQRQTQDPATAIPLQHRHHQPSLFGNMMAATSSTTFHTQHQRMQPQQHQRRQSSTTSPTSTTINRPCAHSITTTPMLSTLPLLPISAAIPTSTLSAPHPMPSQVHTNITETDRLSDIGAGGFKVETLSFSTSTSMVMFGNAAVAEIHQQKQQSYYSLSWCGDRSLAGFFAERRP